jgi:hypothetical protein
MKVELLKEMLIKKVVDPILRIENFIDIFNLCELDFSEVKAISNTDDFTNFVVDQFCNFSCISKNLNLIEKYTGYDNRFIITNLFSNINVKSSMLDYNKKIELLINEFLDRYSPWIIGVKNLSVIDDKIDFDFTDPYDIEYRYDDYKKIISNIAVKIDEFIQEYIINVLELQTYIEAVTDNQLELYYDFIENN